MQCSVLLAPAGTDGRGRVRTSASPQCRHPALQAPARAPARHPARRHRRGLPFKHGARARAQAVQLFGTNWQLLERILPGRPRRALRNKFRAEQRREPARMDAALAGTPSSLENYRQIIRILQARARAAPRPARVDARVRASARARRASTRRPMTDRAVRERG
jgi:hypothetical protein